MADKPIKKRKDPRGPKKKHDPRHMPSQSLTMKEELFCIEYCKDWNAYRAAIAAGYAPKTANNATCQILKKDKIKKRIDKVKNNILEAAGISALSVALEYKKIAFSNPADLFESWGKVKDFDSLTDEQKASLADIKVSEKSYGNVKEQIVQFKLHDKLKALDGLAKLLGLNEAEKTVNINQNTNLDIPIIEWVEEKNEDGE